jgi:osmotically-inducible protein OsmY
MTAVVSGADRHTNKSDQQLEQQIRRQLAADSKAVSRLQIDVSEGVVTLRGIATSFYQKQLWLHGTKRAAGVDAVINDKIEVTASWDTSDFAWRE